MKANLRYKIGHVREDGWVFRGYRKGAAGELEHWISPEAHQRRKATIANAAKRRRKVVRETPELRVAYNERMAAYMREARRLRPEVHMLARVKRRAFERGISFALTADDIRIPKRCPILGIVLTVGDGGATDNSPELDRIDNKKGYVPGNVHVISRRANRIKNDATVAELERIASYLRSLK